MYVPATTHGRTRLRSPPRGDEILRAVRPRDGAGPFRAPPGSAVCCKLEKRHSRRSKQFLTRARRRPSETCAFVDKRYIDDVEGSRQTVALGQRSPDGETTHGTDSWSVIVLASRTNGSRRLRRAHALGLAGDRCGRGPHVKLNHGLTSTKKHQMSANDAPILAAGKARKSKEEKRI